MRIRRGAAVIYIKLEKNVEYWLIRRSPARIALSRQIIRFDSRGWSELAICEKSSSVGYDVYCVRDFDFVDFNIELYILFVGIVI